VTALRWTHRRIFWTLLALAALLRTAAALPLAFHHADELWQYTEPAYHIAVGPWVIAWEMRDGIRTWLIPIFLAGPMALGHLLGAHLLFPKLALTTLSLTIVGSAAALGFRLSRLHGIFAGLVAASWFELVFFGPRALSEPVALALLMGAIGCLLTGVRADGRVFSAGLLLGLAFAARFQFSPAILTLALWEGRTRWRAVWVPLALGGLVGLAIDGAIDLAMGQVPLRWVTENFRLNLIQHRSDGYGVSPGGWYLARIMQIWSWATIPLLLLAWIGARRYPVLLAIALVHLAAHSIIPHKEYRFILPTTALIAILAGIGTADALRRLPAAWLQRGAIGAGLAWVATSTMLAVHLPYRGYWDANTDLPRAVQAAGRVPGVCGFALYRQDHALAAAYALYDRPSPIYAVRGPHAARDAQRFAGAYDVVMADVAQRGELPTSYREIGCYPDASRCLFVRPGPCFGPRPPDLEINAVAADARE